MHHATVQSFGLGLGKALGICSDLLDAAAQKYTVLMMHTTVLSYMH